MGRAEIAAFAVEKLLPQQSVQVLCDEYTYWRYPGSLTTGHAGSDVFTEGVIWSVFKRPIRISYLQVRIIIPLKRGVY